MLSSMFLKGEMFALIPFLPVCGLNCYNIQSPNQSAWNISQVIQYRSSIRSLAFLVFCLQLYLYKEYFYVLTYNKIIIKINKSTFTEFQQAVHCSPTVSYMLHHQKISLKESLLHNLTSIFLLYLHILQLQSSRLMFVHLVQDSL